MNLLSNLFRKTMSVSFTVLVFSSSVLAHTGHTGPEPNPYQPYILYAGALITFTIFASVVYYFITKDTDDSETDAERELEEES